MLAATSFVFQQQTHLSSVVLSRQLWMIPQEDSPTRELFEELLHSLCMLCVLIHWAKNVDETWGRTACSSTAILTLQMLAVVKKKKISVLTKQTHGAWKKSREQLSYSWYPEPYCLGTSHSSSRIHSTWSSVFYFLDVLCLWSVNKNKWCC